MTKQTVPVPDIGGSENVDVIEVSVAPGDTVAIDDPLITLESDKASMEIPSTLAGKVLRVLVKEGDKVSEGAPIVELETEDAAASETVTKSDTEAASAPAKSSSTAAAAPAQSTEIPVAVPDIGGSEGVDVIEICVAVGDEVNEGDSIIVLESDKASMEIPSPASGKVISIAIKEGTKVSEGDPVLVLASGAAPAADLSTASDSAPSAAAASDQPPANRTSPAASTSGSLEVAVPDIGGSTDVEVIEVSVKVGDEVAEGDSIIVLESDKASMEIPSPAAGKVTAIAIKEGDKASKGTPVLTLEVASAPEGSAPVAPEPSRAKAAPSSPAAATEPHKAQTTSQLHPQEIHSPGSSVYAGPAVRKLARQLGVDLGAVRSSGPRGRIAKDDVKAYVKNVMSKQGSASAAQFTGGAGIPAIPEVDFSKFGKVDLVKMSKIHKLTALNMTRNWLNVPHVTQFDDADITDMEEFRKSIKAEAEAAGIKLTPLPFLLKACAAALRYEPSFNVSMHADGEHIVKKDYVHIGIAVATPNGLMVPVIQDVDKKGLYQLAEESNLLAKKARDGKLMPKDMQGGCFTISSLGAMGGTGFTPIVNAPEVAILGVSKASIQPVWNGKEFVPRQLLPLCLSYDHRAINGADAGRFFTFLSGILADIRRLTL